MEEYQNPRKMSASDEFTVEDISTTIDPPSDDQIFCADDDQGEHHDHHVDGHDSVVVAQAPPMQSSSPEGQGQGQGEGSAFSSPSMSKKPLLLSIVPSKVAARRATPWMSRTPNFLTPLGSPIRRAIRLTKLDPQDAWLPITESRNGNAYYAAFHTLCSGIGIQALVLPVSFTVLGW